MKEQGKRPFWPALPQSIATALRALSFLAMSSGELILVREISEKIGAPKPFLSKILHYLQRAGLIESKRGYKGGVKLALDPSQINILDVILAVEGENWKVGCLLSHDGEASKDACPVHGMWRDIRNLIEERLRTVTVNQLPSYESQIHQACPGRKRNSRRKSSGKRKNT